MMAIKLVTPEDWACQRQGTCTVCQNRTDHTSELLSRCVDKTEIERTHVRAGSTVSVCDGPRPTQD
jgi:hypothetical protein